VRVGRGGGKIENRKTKKRSSVGSNKGRSGSELKFTPSRSAVVGRELVARERREHRDEGCKILHIKRGGPG